MEDNHFIRELNQVMLECTNRRDELKRQGDHKAASVYIRLIFPMSDLQLSVKKQMLTKKPVRQRA